VERDIAVDRALYVAGTVVVGSDREEPVAVESLVQLGQVLERRARGLDHVTSLVLVIVALEAIALAGRRNELPKARGVAARVGKRVEGALDHRQECEVARQPARLDLIHDMVHVTLRAPEDTRYVIGVSLQPLDLAVHARVVDLRQGEIAADSCEHVTIGDRRDEWCDGRRLGLEFLGRRGRRLFLVRESNFRRVGSLTIFSVGSELGTGGGVVAQPAANSMKAAATSRGRIRFRASVIGTYPSSCGLRRIPQPRSAAFCRHGAQPMI
jgi:hypothetical protein